MPTLGLDWNYDVYLPADYESNPNKTYPVVYMLHGLYGNHRNLLERSDSSAMLDEAIQTAGQGTIVVFVDGFSSFYIDSADRGLKMESAIMNDLVPYIESTYRVSKDRKDHAIGGISMGDLFCTTPITSARAFCSRLPFGPHLLTTTLFTRLSMLLVMALPAGHGICTSSYFQLSVLVRLIQVRFLSLLQQLPTMA